VKRFFALVLVLAALMCRPAFALDISSQHVISGGVEATSWAVENETFVVLLGGCHSVQTSAGLYTFYGDGVYTPGGPAVRQHKNPLGVSYETAGETQYGFIESLGLISSRVSADPVGVYLPTANLIFLSDEHDAVYAAFLVGASRIPLYADDKGSEKLFDCYGCRCVAAFDYEGDYIPINYDGYDGYVAAEYLQFPAIPEQYVPLTVTSAVDALQLPAADSPVYAEIPADTKLVTSGYIDDWYECYQYGGLVRFYVPVDSAKLDD